LRNVGEPRGEVCVERERDMAAAAGRAIVCAACRHVVTREDERLRVNGSHEHTCVNPHGFVFRIGCFGTAPGCRDAGTPTTGFTWFPGFAWSYAPCGGCAALLGWRYRGGDSASFFGLILDRLATAGDAR
jgi:hypothetical protein